MILKKHFFFSFKIKLSKSSKILALSVERNQGFPDFCWGISPILGSGIPYFSGGTGKHDGTHAKSASK
jgi:hypothetical protein